MSKNFFKSGDWNITCDVCGKKIKASESKHRWDGFIVCSDDFETRHSLDFIRTRSDKILVPFTRPRGEDIFVSTPWADNSPDYEWDMWAAEYCSIDEQTAVAGVGVAGCMRPNKYIMGYL